MSHHDHHPNYLIVTHNTRMRCLLMAIFRNQIELKSAREKDGNILPSILEHKIKKIKFKNASVLKIEIKKLEKNVKLTVSLFYEGELDKKEEEEKGCDYWQNMTFENTNKCLNKNTFQPFECLIPTRLCSEYDFSQECNLYIVRHGQATHNVKGFFAKHLSRDTDLTADGERQAFGAGKQLNHLLSSRNFKFSQFFSSDLKRTRQTFTQIVGQLDLNKITYTTNENGAKSLQLVVLPCAHEIEKMAENGQCDGFDKNLFHQLAKENKTACTLKDDDNIMSECSRIVTNNTVNPIDVKINWAYYRHFYGDKDGFKKGSSERASKDYTRNSFFKSDSRLKCKNYKLSIISSLFDYLRFHEFKKQKWSNMLLFEGRTPGSSTVTEEEEEDESEYNKPNENDEEGNQYENVGNYQNIQRRSPPKYANFFPESIYANVGGGRKSQKRRRTKVIKRLRNRKTRRHYRKHL